MSIASLISLVDIMEFWRRLQLVLGELPDDSSTTLESIFGRLAVEISKAGSFDSELEIVLGPLAASEADSTAWWEESRKLAKLPRPSGRDAGPS